MFAFCRELSIIAPFSLVKTDIGFIFCNNSTKVQHVVTSLALYICNYVNCTKITLSMLWYKVTNRQKTCAVIQSYNLSMYINNNMAL